MSVGQWFTPPPSFVPGKLHDLLEDHDADLFEDRDFDPYLNRELTIDGHSGIILSFADSSAGRVYDFYYDNCEPKKIPAAWFLANATGRKRKNGGV